MDICIYDIYENLSEREAHGSIVESIQNN